MKMGLSQGFSRFTLLLLCVAVTSGLLTVLSFRACGRMDSSVTGIADGNQKESSLPSTTPPPTPSTGGSDSECESELHCEDFNPCTQDLCMNGACSHVALTDGAACQSVQGGECFEGACLKPCSIASECALPPGESECFGAAVPTCEQGYCLYDVLEGEPCSLGGCKGECSSAGVCAPNCECSNESDCPDSIVPSWLSLECVEKLCLSLPNGVNQCGFAPKEGSVLCTVPSVGPGTVRGECQEGACVEQSPDRSPKKNVPLPLPEPFPAPDVRP